MKGIVKYIHNEQIKPQTRTETQRIDVKITEPDTSLVTATTLITVHFQYHYYNVPIVQVGVSNCIYMDLDTSTTYATHFEYTLKDYLFDESDQTYVGCRMFVGVKNLPEKVKYPITGTLPLVITGQGVEKYAGRIEDAIPVIPDGTFDDNAKILQSDPPPSITGLTLSWGTYLVNKIPVLYIKATWDAVIHNDIQGYDSDIKEDGGSYDSAPSPMFNAKNYMIWDSDIKPNQKYYIQVRAVDLAGNTSAWIEGNVTTGNYTTIAAPTGLSATNHPPFSVWLSWTASVSDNVFSYEIYRKTGAGGTYTKIAETSSTFYVDQTVTAGTLYYYKIRAVSTSLSYSDYTSEVSITPALLNDTSIQAGTLFNALGDLSVTTAKLAASSVTALKIHAGALLTYNMTVVNRLRKNMVTATVSSNTISLTGSVVLAKYNGSSYEEVTISVATSGYIAVDTNYWYAYFTPSVDGDGEPLNTSKTISLSTTYPSGLYDVVIGVAQYHYNGTDYKVEWIPYNSVGTIISGDHIATGSIVADTLRSGTITSTSACIGSLTATKITVGKMQSVNTYSYFDLDNNQFRLGSSGGSSLYWNGSSLSITGYATTGDLATKISNGGAASDVNTYSSGLDGISDGSTYKRATSTQLTGAGYAYSYIDSSGRWQSVFKSTSSSNPSDGAGLYMSSTSMGYWDGSGYKTYMDSSGNFYLGGTSGYLTWTAATNTLSVVGEFVTSKSGTNILISPSYAGYIKFRSDTTSYGELYNDISTMVLASYQSLNLNITASANLYLNAGSVYQIYANRPIYEDYFIQVSNASGNGIHFGSSSYVLNADSSSLRYYNGSYTIYLRYNASKIEGSVDGSNWYALW